MHEFYYIIPEKIITSSYKQKKSISISDVDQGKFLICQKSPFVGIQVNNYGVSSDATMVLYSKVPKFAESAVDSDLSGENFVTDLIKVYKVLDVKKEFTSSLIYYIISVQELKS